MKLDKLHFSWSKVLSYNKIWNFVVGQRESGKSVSSWMLIWNAFHYEGRPSLVLRRRTVDITSAYLDDCEKVLNKFLDKPIQLLYLKGDISAGVGDIHIGDAGVNYSWQAIKKLPVFFRVISLATPMARLKSLMLSNVKYMFMDEFIVNLAANERYLKNELFLIQEIYTTFNREAETPIRILAAGNPYSVYCELWVGLGVDTSKVKPGAFVVGDNYVIDCFEASPALKKKILQDNPMYEFDDSYARYAFGGQSILDQNIKIQKLEPKSFKLKFVFKMGKDFISVHRGNDKTTQKEHYWVCKHKEDWLEKVGKKRKIVVFDFRDMSDGTFLIDMEMAKSFYSMKEAMRKRDITFNCIDASYMLEDIYHLI